jgi:hypothetical protein
VQAVLHPVLGFQFDVAVIAVQLDDCLAGVVLHLLEVLVICERVTFAKLFVADVLHLRSPLRSDGSVWVDKSIANIHMVEAIWIVWHFDLVDVEGTPTCLRVFKPNNVASLISVRNLERSEPFSVVRESMGKRRVKSLAMGTAEKTIQTFLADGFIVGFAKGLVACIFINAAAQGRSSSFLVERLVTVLQTDFAIGHDLAEGSRKDFTFLMLGSLHASCL